MALGAEHTDERIAEDGVAEVADVGGFVGVDARMFDEHFAGGGRGDRRGGEGEGDGGAINTEVDIAVAGDFESANSFYGREFVDEFRGDGAGGLAEFPSELTGGGDGEFAEVRLAGLFEDYRGGEAVADEDVLRNGRDDAAF